MSKPSDPRIDTSRVIHAPHGTQLGNAANLLI